MLPETGFIKGILDARRRLPGRVGELLGTKMDEEDPRLNDLNEMIRRLIGEDIELALVLSEEPVRVEADKGHLEQIIMNLAVNARGSACPRCTVS